MILVAGATGTLGGMVARTLLERGQSVRILVRPGSDYAALVTAGAEPVEGDLKDPASLSRACAGVRTVVTTANSVGRGGPDTVESVDRGGNRTLIDAAAAAGVGHFVFVSALGASPESPVDFLRAKAETEAHLKASGISYNILQPDAFMEVWFGMIIGMPIQQGRPIMLIEPARSRHSFVSMRDVAAFITSAVARGPGSSETVVIGGPAALNWREVVAEAERVTGKSLPVTYVPPGTPLPSLPEVVSHLAAGFETYETVVDMEDAAGQYGINLTPAAECLEDMLTPPPAA